MRDLSSLGVFDVEVGGVVFTLRRRTAHLMALVYKDNTALLGQVAGFNANEKNGGTAEGVADAYRRTIEVIDRALPLVLLRIDGDPVDAGFDWSLLEPVAEALFVAFLKSGLDVGPTRGPLPGDTGPS